jgi:hypothetical protein
MHGATIKIDGKLLFSQKRLCCMALVVSYETNLKKKKPRDAFILRSVS